MNDIQIDIAQEKLSDWLEEREEMNENPPEKMKFVLAIRDKMIENRIFFVFKFKKTAKDKWLLGIAGGYTDEETTDCPTAFSGFFECPDEPEQAANLGILLAVMTLQREKAREMLTEWLTGCEEMNGKPPAEMEYDFVIRNKEIDDRIFFAFKFKKSDEDKWLMGIAGGYSDEESLDGSIAFSGFDDYPEDHDDAVGLAYEMAKFMLKFHAQNRAQSAFKQNLEYVVSTELDVEKISRQFVMTRSRFFLAIGVVDVPSGRVIVSDPLCYLSGNNEIAPILEKEIPKGIYRVEVSLYRGKDIGIRICSARLKIKETAVVRYELAKPTPETAAFKDENGVTCGFPVEAGLISFIDADGAEVYRKVDKEWWAEHPGGNRYNDYFKELFAKSYELLPDYQREGGDFIQWVNPENNERMVMAASGLGDGFYRCFWGYDEDDEICELIVPMVDPDIFENQDYDDDEDDEDEDYDDDDYDDDDDDDEDDDDLNTRWKEAYRANPHAYEKEDGTLLVDFALTEDTDSIFPIVPEEHWAIDGKTISDWIISIVSITKDGVIGTIEYHEAIKRLEEHFLAEKDGWALIEGLTLDELEELFDGLPRNAL